MRLIASFTPQAWVNDSAITCDVEGESTWDVTEHLNSLSPADRAEAMETDSHESDALRDLDAAPAWVKNWSGPFYISVSSVDGAEPDASPEAEHASVAVPAPPLLDPMVARLQVLKGEGLSFAQIMQLYGETAEESRHVAYARDRLTREGEIEVDDRAVVSEGADPGCYVSAWLWVSDQDAGIADDDDDGDAIPVSAHATTA